LHVASNESFDLNDEHQNHPGRSELRVQLEQRWKDLIEATSALAASSRASSSSPATRPNTDCGVVAHSKKRKASNGSDDHDRLRSPFEKTATTTAPSAQQPQQKQWFRAICDKHSEAARHYHTLVHLWELFELLDVVLASKPPSCSDRNRWYVPMAWSVFFHDSIYDPKSRRNEKESAKLFGEFVDEAMGRNDASAATRTMDDDTIGTVETMILATEKHEVIVPTTKATAQHQEEKIAMQEHFLDIDMAVLGKQRKAYRKYAALIRKEYEWVSHDMYCSERAKILEKFLGEGSSAAGSSDGSSGDKNDNIASSSMKKHIYITEPFRRAFEDRARCNLRDEIQLLRKNVLPE